jgi:hypothetical protein
MTLKLISSGILRNVICRYMLMFLTEDEGSIFLRIPGILLPEYAALYVIRSQILILQP